MRHIFLILILFSQSIVVFSQGEINSIQGVVTDPNGAVIPKAKVVATLLTEKIKKEKTTEAFTSDYGEFKLKNLPSGDYKLSVSAAGFGSETEKLITVPRDKRIENKVQIKLGLGCDRLAEKSGTVTDEDKSQILKLAVADAFRESLGLLESEQKSNGIIISTKNIKTEWLKNVSFPKMEFMSQAQIQQKADRDGDFLFVSFPYLKVKGQCVALEVANTWAVGRNSESAYLSGGGYRYEFRKENGKWVLNAIGGWVS